MPRPRPDSPVELYTVTELEIGSGLPVRSFEYLRRAQLAPSPLVSANGPGTTAIFDYEAGLVRCAIIGAVFAAGPSLVMATQLGTEIYGELDLADREKMSRIRYYRDIGRFLKPEDYDDRGNVIEPKVHARLVDHPKIYKPGAARSDDLRVYVVDRKFVFSRYGNMPTASAFGGRNAPAEMRFHIKGWARNSEKLEKISSITFESFESTLPLDWWDNVDAKERARQLEEMANQALENAVSMISINVSLAIRNALDRIHELRQSKTASRDRELSEAGE
jgi:hypothetical protein